MKPWKKICTVVGARPQFIKAAVVSRALRSCDNVNEILIHTGQHYDRMLSEVFFEELGIAAPKHSLGIGSGSHGEQTGEMLSAIERVLETEKPDGVLVFGDTNSTLAGALAAAKLHIPVAHVEAGLRSFNRRMPEEINRVLTDHCSQVLFAPTEAAVENLAREGVSGSAVHLVGDVMYDSALYFAKRAAGRRGLLEEYSLADGEYILATVHRAENTDDAGRLGAIVEALTEIGRERTVVLPLHPRTRLALQRSRLLDSLTTGVRLIDPVGYLDMVSLEMHAGLIVTDSGGVQKEAYCHRVPCVTVRDETEWVELVESGWNRLAPPVSAAAVRRVIEESLARRPVTAGLEDAPLYGRGKAVERIIEILLNAN
jgi:UDP-GlcNAc3NAcA epimerase